MYTINIKRTSNSRLAKIKSLLNCYKEDHKFLLIHVTRSIQLAKPISSRYFETAHSHVVPCNQDLWLVYRDVH